MSIKFSNHPFLVTVDNSEHSTKSKQQKLLCYFVVLYPYLMLRHPSLTEQSQNLVLKGVKDLKVLLYFSLLTIFLMFLFVVLSFIVVLIWVVESINIFNTHFFIGFNFLILKYQVKFYARSFRNLQIWNAKVEREAQQSQMQSFFTSIQ